MQVKMADGTSATQELDDENCIKVCCGGNVNLGERELCVVRNYKPRELKPDTPTAYRVLKGDVYKKPAKDSEKILKLERKVGTIVRTTGEVFEGPNGGRWAELDQESGEKKGWVYIEGPGFGPSTRKIRTEWLRT